MRAVSNACLLLGLAYHASCLTQSPAAVSAAYGGKNLHVQPAPEWQPRLRMNGTVIAAPSRRSDWLTPPTGAGVTRLDPATTRESKVLKVITTGT